MSFEYKQADVEQLKDMKEFVDICSAGLDILTKYSMNSDLHMTIVKIREAMCWFNLFIMGGGQKQKVPESPTLVEVPMTGTVN